MYKEMNTREFNEALGVGQESIPNGQAWAEAFVEITRTKEVSEDTCRGWFANAIMAGYDYGYRAGKDLINKAEVGKHTLQWFKRGVLVPCDPDGPLTIPKSSPKPKPRIDRNSFMLGWVIAAFIQGIVVWLLLR